jgi:hypothetical protein
MRICTALLCDFAQVRDNLLMVSSGAITRIYRPDLPAHLNFMVAVVIEVPLEDTGESHTLAAQVINRAGAELAVGTSRFEVGNEGLFPYEIQQVGVVLSLANLRAQSWGTHQVRLAIDRELAEVLTFYVVPDSNGSGSHEVTHVAEAASSRPVLVDLSDGGGSSRDAP